MTQEYGRKQSFEYKSLKLYFIIVKNTFSTKTNISFVYDYSVDDVLKFFETTCVKPLKIYEVPKAMFIDLSPDSNTFYTFYDISPNEREPFLDFDKVEKNLVYSARL